MDWRCMACRGNKGTVYLHRGQLFCIHCFPIAELPWTDQPRMLRLRCEAVRKHIATRRQQRREGQERLNICNLLTLPSERDRVSEETR